LAFPWPRLEHRSHTKEDCDPFPIVSLDEVHVTSVLDIGVVVVEDDWIDALGRWIKRSKRWLAAVYTFSVTSLGTAFRSEEVVPSILLQDVTALSDSQVWRFGQDRLGQGWSGSEIDFVDPRLDFRVAVYWRRSEVESCHGLVDFTVVVK
jgi:hypothetical protein